jgi:hypothetical protein
MSRDAHQIGIAIGKMVARLEEKRATLRAMEARSGRVPKTHLPRMVKLREEIESLVRRIEVAERLQDASANG